MRRLGALSICLAFGLLLLRPVRDADTFWHLSLGKAVAQAHARSFPDPIALESFHHPCVVAEWLWDLANYAVFSQLGFRGLSVLLALLALLSCALIVRFVAIHARDSLAAFFVVSTLACTVVMSRAVLRPQVAAAILLSAFLLLTSKYADTRNARRRAVLGGLLVALELLWVQVHGSFVLGPALLGAATVTAWRRAPAVERRQDLLCLLGLSLAMLSSSFGASFFEYLLVHAHSDAVRHIGDMRPPAWADLTPAEPYNAAFLLLLALGAIGAGVATEHRWRSILWAGLGVGLELTANRFADTSAILLIPLAASGVRRVADRLHAGRRAVRIGAQALSVGGCVALAVWFAVAAPRWMGPWGHPGLAEERLPMVAGAAIRALPPKQNVLSSYEGDGPLGFFVLGHSRTFVDGRTPVVFDDVDYGVARDIWHKGTSLRRGLERYAITAVVAPRDSDLCRRMALLWSPVATELAFTTFVPREAGAPALTALSACGEDLLPADPCQREADVLSELTRLDALHSSPLFSISRADTLIRCRHPVRDAVEAMPSVAGAWSYPLLWNRTTARILIAENRPTEAFGRVERQIRDGDVEAFQIVFPAIVDQVPARTIQRTLEALARTLDSTTPTMVRVAIAKLCMLEGNEDCVRFHAVRAAAAGDANARVPLEWLRKNSASQSVRDDAAAWLATIQRE